MTWSEIGVVRWHVLHGSACIIYLICMKCLWMMWCVWRYMLLIICEWYDIYYSTMHLRYVWDMICEWYICYGTIRLTIWLWLWYAMWMIWYMLLYDKFENPTLIVICFMIWYVYDIVTPQKWRKATYARPKGSKEENYED